MSNLLNDPVLGLVLLGIVALFMFVLSISIYCSVRQVQPRIGLTPNFTYAGTIIVGLVLSVASGVIGKPVKLPNESQQISVQDVANLNIDSSQPAEVTPDQTK